jgi:hypothetical protein
MWACLFLNVVSWCMWSLVEVVNVICTSPDNENFESFFWMVQ